MATPTQDPQSAFPAPPPLTTRTGTWPIVLPVLLLAIVLAALIQFAPFAGRAASDQQLYHVPTIRLFADRWPGAPTRDDLRGYLSATTPGFHLALAPLAGPSAKNGASDRTIQYAAAVFTLACVGVLAWRVTKGQMANGQMAKWESSPSSPRGLHLRFGPLPLGSLPLGHLALPLLCLLPLLCSPFFLLGGVYVLPDNAGWLGVVVGLVLALGRLDATRHSRTRDLLWLVACAAWLVVVVLLRQSHLWVGSAIIVTAYLVPIGTRSSSSDSSNAASFKAVSSTSRSDVLPPVDRLFTRLASSALAALTLVPATLVLAWFVNLWGGLVPVRFQGQHSAGGANLATPALVLALLALYSMFLAGFIVPTLARLWRTHRWLLVLAALLGVALAAIPTTTYLYPQRGSGIWGLVKLLDDAGLSIAGRTSPLFLILTPLGAVALCGWLAALANPRRWLYLGALIAFTLAQTANTNAWQRYIEPGLLIFLALWCAEVWAAGPTASAHILPARTRRGPQWLGRVDGARLADLMRPAGLLALGLVLASITAITQSRAERIDPNFPPPIAPEVDMRPLDDIVRHKTPD